MSACPACSNSMLIFELNGIEIDSCSECGGTWLDAGELELMYELEDAEPNVDLVALLNRPSQGLLAKRRCIRCDCKLEILKFETPKLEIDRCPLGHGYWFDQGELITLIESSATLGKGIVSEFLRELFRARYPDAQKENAP